MRCKPWRAAAGRWRWLPAARDTSDDRHYDTTTASGGPRREGRGGRDCPRRKQRWTCLPETRAMAATATSRGAIGGGGNDLPRHEWWWLQWPSMVAFEDNDLLRCGASKGVPLRRPSLIWWSLRRPLVWQPRDRPPATNYLIHVYVIDDYVLCLLITLFMHFSDYFYDDEYNFYFCHKIVSNSREGY
jgi:hypothetical protein